MDLFTQDPSGPTGERGDQGRLLEHPDGRSPSSATPAPLAERMRPLHIDGILGQAELLGPGGPLRAVIERDRIHSMILWGPPGSGKTTLARVIARSTRSQFVSYSAVLSGIREIREVMSAAERHQRSTGRRTILFIDEIHRFNRAQQDAFLPYVERGTVVLVGATTENPSFEVNAALLSRCAVYVLRPLADDAIATLLRRALTEPQGVADRRLAVCEEDLNDIAARAGGDARRALNILELLSLAEPPGPDGTRPVDRQAIDRAVQRAPLLYDKSGEEHFNLISALHKSLRNSDPDASVYWLTRMLESGEDPLYVARRMVRFASEDVGNADPQALAMALAAREAYEILGMPEGALALAQAAIYLAAAPKSNAVYAACVKVREDLRRGMVDPVPMALRNAPTGLMKGLGYGRDYRYAHDFDEGTTDLECLPQRLRGRKYYQPRPIGHEKVIKERLERLEAVRRRFRRDRRGE